MTTYNIYLSINYGYKQTWLPNVHMVFNSTDGDGKTQVSCIDTDEEEKSDEDEEPHFVVGGK